MDRVQVQLTLNFDMLFNIFGGIKLKKLKDYQLS
jgi:hypothetical protein